MIRKFISGYFSQLSEGKIMLEELYKKRSQKKGIPSMSDGEFFSYFRADDEAFRALKEACRERNFDVAKHELIAYYRRREEPKFFFSLLNGEKLKSIARESNFSYRYIIESSERICAHIIDNPTGISKSFGTFIDWFSDFNGKSWVYCHVSDLNKKLQDKHFQKLYDLSNLPLTMEFNKHHHLVDLARAYAITGDEKYAQEYVVELEDWIGKNPANWGVNWLDSLAVLQRTISWLFSLGLFIHSPHLTGSIFCTILKALFFHGAYIVEQLSDKTTKPAKLIGLASALYILASFFPEFEFLKRWKEKALKVIEREVEVQFSPDGVHREQSLGLQCLLTEFLMLPLIWDRMNKLYSSSALRTSVERSIEFLMYNIQPNGSVQIFGEMPITRAWRLSTAPHEDYKSLLALGALLYGRSDMKSLAGENVEDILWFFGEEGYRTYASLPSRRPESLSKAFGEGGYIFFRDGWERDANFTLFHSGPKKRWGFLEKGMEGLSSHRDLLNLALTIRGEPFIIETGSYRGKKKFNNYFCRSFAHNVIVIDGREQSMYKNFKSSKKFMSLLKTRWIFTDDFDYVVSGSPGFEDLKSLVIHRREILYLKKKKWFLIKDSLEGFDEFLVELNFHFAPEIEIILRGDYGCFIRGRRDFVRLNPYFPGDFSCSLNRGKVDPLSGWYAKDFSRVEPCYRLEYFARMRLPAEIFTWVSWARGEFRIPPKDELNDFFLNINDMGGISESEPVLEA
jgi:hypothetical protein